ncbi:drug/metabolite transporter (DMT)-like permease [Crossiella equi]|uniref:Drug/metabolite transporter (DMT)-like permease n=1 Tax=Crossiella equi TaxID=130796 RepID=A0ABS5A7M7_9PSEU|nr:DMT family transporter [Crossiella equi]MBP2472591.1 drug/metabolite transporter (DMT)-like permease [Crossiella equi]
MLLGLLGVLGFSFSLPFTRIAVEHLSPWFVAFGRAVLAGVLALGYLAVTGFGRLTARQVRSLLVVAFGVVIGFPLFSSLALTMQTASHGAVVITVLPAATAVWAVLRAGERPNGRFWLASGAGLVAVLLFVATTGALTGGFELADLLLLASVVVCGLGYAEGGALSRDLGGARTICWALVLSLPGTVPVALLTMPAAPAQVPVPSWLGFGYLSLVSMFLGFFAWYAGLARGGVARVGQTQLAQPVLTLTWSVLLLGEKVGVFTAVMAGVVLACVVLTQRSRETTPQVGGERPTPLLARRS